MKMWDEQMKAVLERAQGWQDVHDLLSAHGAVIKPRGAGLAIATLDGKVGIKASSLDRKLSFKSLTDRFGEYEPPKHREKRSKHYRPDARKKSETSVLYAEYQTTRQTNAEARTKGLRELRTEQYEYRLEVKDRYGQRRASVKANKEMDNRTKRSAYHELSQQRKRELACLKQGEEVQKEAIRERSPAITWDNYLVNRDASTTLVGSQHLQELGTRKNLDTAFGCHHVIEVFAII